MGESDKRDGLKPETLRKRSYRERRRLGLATGKLASAADVAEALGLTSGTGQDAPGQDGAPVKRKRGRPRKVEGLNGSKQETSGSKILKGLSRIAADPHTGAQARVMAARAVLEVQGQLGRHAPPPRDKAEMLPPQLLTRAGLVAELARLRALRTTTAERISHEDDV